MARNSLHRRFLQHNLALLALLVIFGVCLLWRLHKLSARVNISQTIYAELRSLNAISAEVGTINGLLTDPRDNRANVADHLNYAIGGLDQFLRVSKGYGSDDDRALAQAYAPIDRSAMNARATLQGVLDDLRKDDDAASRAKHAEALASVREQIGSIDSSCLQIVSTRQGQASHDVAVNLMLAAIFCGVALAVTIGASLLQYRMILVPIERLRRSVRDVSSADFSGQIDATRVGNSREFVELTDEFNNMARQLDAFYRNLEEQVRQQSAALVRSERLASVGFLAAGVAHEINNPLNIISGYAEIAARKLLADAPPTAQGSAAEALSNHLRIIREEAFRCKEITEKLLSLSRGSSSSRECIDLASVAREVVTMTGGLENYRDRHITLKFEQDRPLQVQANLTEMKQVLLNLTINALEAVPAGKGEVCIEGRAENGWVEISVKDNGRGIGADSLGHVFEPFFTTRSNGHDRGTGLGLSITHAIIENHRGRIDAQSQGQGHGATFTVRLPAAGEKRQTL